MADTKATSTKASSSAKPKSAADGAPSPAGGGEAKAPEASLRGTCSVEQCGRALRAKGYCRRHFLLWRRGELGAHHHYKVCTKEGCRKARARGGLCAEHAGLPQAGATPA